MTISLTELLIVGAVLMATIVWVVTLGLVAVHRTLTPTQRVGWIAVIALTHIAGAIAFLVWERLTGGSTARFSTEPGNRGT